MESLGWSSNSSKATISLPRAAGSPRETLSPTGRSRQVTKNRPRLLPGPPSLSPCFPAWPTAAQRGNQLRASFLHTLPHHHRPGLSCKMGIRGREGFWGADFQKGDFRGLPIFFFFSRCYRQGAPYDRDTSGYYPIVMFKLYRTPSSLSLSLSLYLSERAEDKILSCIHHGQTYPMLTHTPTYIGTQILFTYKGWLHTYIYST